MKYRSEEIGTPTYEIVSECCKELKVDVPAEEVFDYWQKKDFKTKKGNVVFSVEVMVNVVNSIYVQQMRKDSGICISKQKNDLKRLMNLMAVIQKNDSAVFDRILSEAEELAISYSD